MQRSESVRILAALIVLFPFFGFPVQGQSAARGPLRVHPTNPRYFTDGSGKTVYLTGAHTWGNLAGFSDRPAFDFQVYLDFLQRYNHNFIRLWSGYHGGAMHSPYRRTGPGTALDGLRKVDLDQLDPAYFDLLRSRVIAARDRGIYVAIMLFHPDGYQAGDDWDQQFFNPANNIQGINADLNGDGMGIEIYDLSIPQVTASQEAYVLNVIEAVNDLDNVLYEIGNEGLSAGWAWQYHMINFIRAHEAGMPSQHPVGMTCFHDNHTGAIWASSAEWISPGEDTGPYSSNPPAADGSKVILLDNDHFSGPTDHVWVWKSFLRGHNPILMDVCDHYPDILPVLGGLQRLDPMRRAAGYTLSYANRMNLAAMTPLDGLSSTGYCLAQPGSEYLVYQPAGGSFTVNLVAGNYAYEWFDAVAGSVSATGTISAPGGNQGFTPPFAGDGVVYLKASRGTVPPISEGPSPIAWWRFNENQGLTAADSSGNGQHGTLTHGPAWTPGPRGNSALSFDGINDYVEIAPSSSIGTLTQNLTIAAWVHPNTIPLNPHERQAIFQFGELFQAGTGAFGFQIEEQGILHFITRNVTEHWSTTVRLVPGRWYHVAAVMHPNTDVTYYLDGAEMDTVAGGGPAIPNAIDRIFIGAGADGTADPVRWWFNGAIDDVRIYARALSGNEINAILMETGTSPPGGMISNTSPAGYAWDTLDSGKRQYVDRAYTFSSVPSSYVGLQYLKTANDDKRSTGNSWVTFTVDRDVTVYVAHDDAIGVKPSWLAGWTDNGEQLVSGGGTFSLFQKNFVAGTVVVGGNTQDGTGDWSMYTVIVRAQAPAGGTGGTGGTGPTGGGGRENDDGDRWINDRCGAIGLEALILIGVCCGIRRRRRNTA
jgi:hypothetical protein